MLESVDLLAAVSIHIQITRMNSSLTEPRLASGTMSDNSKRVGCGQLQLHCCFHDNACYLERQWIISRERLALDRGP
jgi:hypothetical protein